MLENLRDKEYQAMVLDAPAVQVRKWKCGDCYCCCRSSNECCYCCLGTSFYRSSLHARKGMVICCSSQQPV
jgi:hypothetical protein